MSAVEAPSEDDIASRRIIRADFGEQYFSPLPKAHLDVYREALLIFYSKVSVYLRQSSGPFRSNGGTGSANRDARPNAHSYVCRRAGTASSGPVT